MAMVPDLPKRQTPMAELPKQYQVLQYLYEGHSIDDAVREYNYENGDYVYRLLRKAIHGLAMGDLDAMRARELLKCEHIESRVWKEWYRSCQDEVTVTEKRNADGELESTTTVRKGRSGNPALMKIVLEAMRRTSSLAGLDLEKRQEQGSGNVHVHQMSDEQLIVIAGRGNPGDGAGRIADQGLSAAESFGLHEVHQARLPCLVAPRTDSGAP